MALSGIEGVKLLGLFALAIHSKLADDKKIDLGEWVEIATEVGSKVFEEYSDEDDV